MCLGPDFFQSEIEPFEVERSESIPFLGPPLCSTL